MDLDDPSWLRWWCFLGASTAELLFRYLSSGRMPSVRDAPLFRARQSLHRSPKRLTTLWQLTEPWRKDVSLKLAELGIQGIIMVELT